MHPPVGLESGRQGQPEQPAFPGGLHPRHGTDRRHIAFRRYALDPGAVTLGDQRVPAEQEIDSPRHGQVPRHDSGDLRVRHRRGSRIR